jgi:hypothetical protein
MRSAIFLLPSDYLRDIIRLITSHKVGGKLLLIELKTKIKAR